MNWKIFYTDGSAYTDQDGPPQNAPGHIGVQAISLHSDVTGRYNLIGYDFYIWEYEQWVGVDLVGHLFYIQRADWAKTLKGQMLPSDIFARVLETIEADTYLSPRSGYVPGERRLPA